MSFIVSLQSKVYNLPKDIHYILREFGVIQVNNKYLMCIGKLDMSKYEKLNNMVKKKYYKKRILNKMLSDGFVHRTIIIHLKDAKFVSKGIGKKSCRYGYLNYSPTICEYIDIHKNGKHKYYSLFANNIIPHEAKSSFCCIVM
jgi:hypothetical protein